MLLSGVRIDVKTQKKRSQPRTPCKSVRARGLEGAANDANGVTSVASRGGSWIFASFPHRGQTSEASGICWPHRAQNMVKSHSLVSSTWYLQDCAIGANDAKHSLLQC